MLDRYSRPEMRAIWNEESKFGAWLKVELLACEAWSQLGEIKVKFQLRMWRSCGRMLHSILIGFMKLKVKPNMTS
mgnify:CR=1 FL=1